jgi:folylpolyglutamate synthase/dihydropteroate synthase
VEGLYKTGDLIVVTGSFYTIGEAKEAFGHKGVLTGLRE